MAYILHDVVPANNPGYLTVTVISDETKEVLKFNIDSVGKTVDEVLAEAGTMCQQQSKTLDYMEFKPYCGKELPV